nr:reverse transcriptase domain-containing protein [Tanacetum cinerariifolium]
MIRAVRINVPLVDVLVGMPNYGKFLKELINNKHKIEQISVAFLSDESSAMIQNKVPAKLKDPESFLIPCNFNKTFSCNTLVDLSTSINLMPYSLYAKLYLETLKPTKMSVRLADTSFQYPVGIAGNMLVEVGKFIFPADFVILEMEEDNKVLIILGRPFLHTADAVIQVKQKQLILGVGTELCYCTVGIMYVNDHADIFDMVDINLFTVVALYMMVVQLEHGVTALDSYIRAPRFRATIKDIADEPGSIAPIEHRSKKMLLTWHDSSEPTNEAVCESDTPRSLPEHDFSTPCKDSICEIITPGCLPHRFGDVARSGVESCNLSHDESFRVDDLDLNLNELEPIVEEVKTQEPIVEDVIVEDYVTYGEDAEQCNGQEDKLAPSDGHFFYYDEGIDTAYETKYVVQSSRDAGTDDDDDYDDEDFLVDEENDVVEPDVDVHLFGISMDFPFDNIEVTNLVPYDVLE